MRKVLLALAAVTVMAAAAPAQAEEEFDLKVNGTTVVVQTKGGWHVNKEYPWSLKVGPTKVEKAKFDLKENTATLTGAPPGEGTLNIGVCSGNQCKTFKVSVKI